MKRVEFLKKAAIAGTAITAAPLLVSAKNKSGVILSLERDKLIKWSPQLDARLYPRHIEAYELGMMSPSENMQVSSGEDVIRYHFLSEVVTGECESLDKRKTFIVRRSVKVTTHGSVEAIRQIDAERHLFLKDCEKAHKGILHTTDAFSSKL